MFKKFVIFILFCLSLTKSFSQTKPKISAYLKTQVNKTIYDSTIGNNPYGLGLGVQFCLNNNLKIKPIIDFTATTYLEDDKVLRTNSNGTEIKDVRNMVNVFAGASIEPSKIFYLSASTGASFINGKMYLGFKPSIGTYFSETKRWVGSISYLNIFNRQKSTKEDFGSINLSIGLKLF